MKKIMHNKVFRGYQGPEYIVWTYWGKWYFRFDDRYFLSEEEECEFFPTKKEAIIRAEYYRANRYGKNY